VNIKIEKERIKLIVACQKELLGKFNFKNKSKKTKPIRNKPCPD